MKFLIKVKYQPEKTIGTNTEFLTGPPPALSMVDHLAVMEMDGDTPTYKTGMQLFNIKENPKLDGFEEREKFEKLAEELIEKIGQRFQSSKKPSGSFWTPEKVMLKLDSSALAKVYDTENIDDALLFLNILSGSFSLVSPSLQIAERTGDTFYLTTQDEAAKKAYDDDYGTKLKATTALGNMLEDEGTLPLVYISYLIPGVKGYTKNVKRPVIEQEFMDYIEGKSVKTGKKECSDNFYQWAKLWKSNRDELIGKAVVAKAISDNLLVKNSNKKYETKYGTELGSNLEEVYRKLNKPENQNEFEEISGQINTMLNN